MNIRRYLARTVLLLAALASLLLLPRTERAPETGITARPGIGYYLDQAELTVTDAGGRTLYRLHATAARQNLLDGGIVLDEIALRYDPLLATPWRATAASGSIPADGRIIALSGEVIAVAGPDQPLPTTIRTEYLELDPEAHIATTDHSVLIERPDGTLSARGLRFHLKEDRLQLLADVHGHFPARQP